MLDRNIRIYKLLSIFGYPYLWQPVLYLYLTQIKAQSASEALIISSMFSLGAVILEVPGGAIADHISRKFSAGIGYLLAGLGFYTLTLSDSYLGLILSMLIVSLGDSLTSGSLESLVYDSIKNTKQMSSKYFKKIFASTRSILHFSLAIFIFLGGYLGSYNLETPIRLSVAGYLIAAILCSQLIEPKKEITAKKYLDRIIDSAKFIFSRKGLKAGIMQLFISDFFILGLISAMFWLTTPILSSLGINIYWIGIITASMRLLKSFGSYFVTLFDDPNDLRTMIITSVIMIASMLIGGLVYTIPLVIACISMLYLVQAFYQANDSQLLNDKIGDLDRTTINSFQSVFKRLYEFSILPVVGFLLDRGYPQQALLTISILLGIGTLILFASKSRLTIKTTVPISV